MHDIKWFWGSRKRGCDVTGFKRENEADSLRQNEEILCNGEKSPQFFILILHNKIRERSVDPNK